MGTLRQDLRFALRSLSRSPAFTAIAVATLALGIGANTAVFSIVRGVLLRPLPYLNAQRLIVGSASIPDSQDIRRGAPAVEDAALFASNLYNVGVGQDTEQLRGALVTREFFRIVGGTALAGRTLGDGDAGEPVVVLSQGLAARSFGSPAAALGRTVPLSGRAFTVVGVLPAEFELPGREYELWIPFEHEMARTPAMAANRGLRIFRMIALIRPGVSVASARSQIAAVSTRLQREYPDTNRGVTTDLVPLADRVLSGSRPALGALFAAVGLVLLIASSNVAGLLLARGAGRERELAIRAALGASRGRLVRQLLTESLLLSLAGAIAGALLAAWAVSALPLVAPAGLPRLAEIRVDRGVLLFTLAASAATGILFGLVPALQGSRANLAGGASASGRASAGRGRLRASLVVAEVALAVVVLVGAGLLVRSLQSLLRVEKGFEPQSLTSFSLNLYDLDGDSAREGAAQEVVRRIRTLPGVSSAGAGSALPPETAQRATRFEIEGRPASQGDADSAYFVGATAGYLETLGTHVLEGRAFTEADRANSSRVALISRGLAHRLFPAGGALGRRIRLLNPDQSPEWREIVGVVEDVRYSGLADPGDSAVYTPFSQTPFLWAYVMVRSAAPLATLAPMLRDAVRAVQPSLVAARIRPVDRLVDESVAAPRFHASLLSAFAALALALAALGLFGLLSYTAATQRREIGIRIALGASPRDVFARIAGGGLGLVAIGLALGVAASLAAGRAVSGLLFEVRPTDPATYVGIAAVMVATGFAAGAIPARRASRVDPANALRGD
ncbi:MAG TPA: ABC transporter permease [Thermoanaerobaculia bacterium]|nr:ABC transporter permease [Thermoanaerobaculia bacterium]